MNRTPSEISSWEARGYRGYIYEWIMKRLGDVWQWNPFSPFGSYALLYRKIYAYRMVYRRMAVYAIFMITYMRIYPAEYILYLHLAKQLDKQHLLKLYTLINVGRRASYLWRCEWILYDSSKEYSLSYICIVCKDIKI